MYGTVAGKARERVGFLDTSGPSDDEIRGQRDRATAERDAYNEQIVCFSGA